MKRAFYLLSFVLMICSCGGRPTTSTKEVDEITMPECRGEALESERWSSHALGLSMNGLWCFDNKVPILDVGFNDNNRFFIIEDVYYKIPSESSVVFSNALNSDVLEIKLKNHTARNYDAIRAFMYLFNHQEKVTLTVDSINEGEPFVFYYDSLDGIQEAYNYYVKMFHPDLSGTVVKSAD